MRAGRTLFWATTFDPYILAAAFCDPLSQSLQRSRIRFEVWTKTSWEECGPRDVA